MSGKFQIFINNNIGKIVRIDGPKKGLQFRLIYATLKRHVNY